MAIRRIVLFSIGILILGVGSFAQQKKTNYNSLFQKVDELLNKSGLTKSALAKVDSIYRIATIEKQEVQLIKALIYKFSIQPRIQENAEVVGFAQLEAEIKKSSQLATSILHSLLASKYLEYFQQQRYKIYSRTKTTNFQKSDPDTWTISDFHEKIADHFQRSLVNEKLLQETGLSEFDPIIFKGNSRYLRPTLFDMLAHKALEYYKNSENDFGRPASEFQIMGKIPFDRGIDFSNYRFRTSDSLSNLYKALTLYQRLIRFHLAKKNIEALIDIDLQRVVFVMSKSVDENKLKLYRTALAHIGTGYSGEPGGSQAWYLLAHTYFENRDEYIPGDSLHRFDLVQAKLILERVVAKRDSSEGFINS
ncbi:MAG: alpha-2-macroglobulin, partial [Gemmatimonadaceae bacterium]|nr:alpha-2-macroglobulin [Chitinophagaceae bacterium]